MYIQYKYYHTHLEFFANGTVHCHQHHAALAQDVGHMHTHTCAHDAHAHAHTHLPGAWVETEARELSGTMFTCVWSAGVDGIVCTLVMDSCLRSLRTGV